MTLGVYSGCPWILFVVFHHWPIDSYKASPGSCGYCISTLSEPPELSICDFDGQLEIRRQSCLELKSPLRWSLWWALISQRLSGHILLRGEHGCSQDRALKWTQKAHDHWCVPEIPVLEHGKLTQYRTCCYSVRKWCFLCLTVRWNETHFGNIPLNFPWQPVITVLSEYKCFLPASSSHNLLFW